MARETDGSATSTGRTGALALSTPLLAAGLRVGRIGLRRPRTVTRTRHTRRDFAGRVRAGILHRLPRVLPASLLASAAAVFAAASANVMGPPIFVLDRIDRTSTHDHRALWWQASCGVRSSKSAASINRATCTSSATTDTCSEVFSLTAPQVDIANNVVRFEPGTTKNKAGPDGRRDRRPPDDTAGEV